MADHPIVLQGKTHDYNRNQVNRFHKNFDPGRGRSLQTIELLSLRNRKPLPNSINKFLFLSKKKNAEGETVRAILKGYLAEQADEHNGYVHGETEDAINFLVNQRLDSQKPGYKVAIRPLFSYSEKNADEKRCKYGAYKDGSRYRCVQNLNHKKGGGGDVTARASQKTAKGEDDDRTKLQRRAINVPPYVRKGRPIRRADEQDTEPQTEAVAIRPPKINRELARLQNYLNDPKTQPTSGKRKR